MLAGRDNSFLRRPLAIHSYGVTLLRTIYIYLPPLTTHHHGLSHTYILQRDPLRKRILLCIHYISIINILKYDANRLRHSKGQAGHRCGRYNIMIYVQLVLSQQAGLRVDPILDRNNNNAGLCII